MASYNRVILVGNLTRDPEVRYLPAGTAVCDMRLAISESYKSKSGEQVESVCYVDVVVWARQAETCGQYLSKGSPVLVEGALQLDEWKTKEGEKRSKLRVRASRVQFLGSPRGAEFRDGRGSGKAGAPESSAPPVEEEEEIPDEAVAGEGAGEGAGDEDNLPF